MSKVAEAIPVATRAAKNNTPFFSKGGGSFLSSSAETESPFFTHYSKPAVQAKLTIGQPNDKYEQEADAVAEKVVQKLNDHSPLQTKPLVPATSVIQPKCAECENEELQKKEDEAKDETIPECKTSLSGADLPGIPPSANENTHNKTNSAIQLKCSACEAESSESFQKEEKPETESKRIPLQAKLNIGTPGDPFEKEADAVADQVVEKINQPTAIQSKPIIPISSVNNFVLSKCDACEQENSEEQQDDKKENSPIEMQKKAMGMSVPDQPGDDENSGQKNNTLQLRCDSCLTEKIEPAIQSMPIYKKATHPMVRRKCSECEKEDKLQRSEDNSTGKLSAPSLESRLSASRGGGFSLPESVRQGMESSIGADFGDVKIHTDSSAVQLNKELNAQAFAHGSDIYFNSGKYNPENKDGQHLLAHSTLYLIEQRCYPYVFSHLRSRLL